MIIKNGCTSEIGKSQLIIINTCPLDSLSEVLSFGYLNFSHFRNFVSSRITLSDYFLSVVCHAKNGATSEYYQKRLTVLRALYPEKSYRIDCSDDISVLFEKLMTTHESIVEKKNCPFCEFLDTKQMSILNINARLVWNYGLDSLEESVLNEILNKKFNCKNCIKLVFGRAMTISSYLCLNISHFYEQFGFRSDYNRPPLLKSNLREIPTKLTILNKKYLLFGVIEYRPPTALTKIGHYVAYTRTINNKWTQLNDLEPYPIVLTSGLDEIRICLLFYALA